MADYGCAVAGGSPAYNRTGFPVWLPASPFIKIDQGGDSGNGEIALFVLDYILAMNASADSLAYLHIATAVADYYRSHFSVNATTGRVVITPTQVLESFWCDYNANSHEFQNCCADDTPSVTAMMAVFEKLLKLPDGVLTPSQAANFSAFSHALPELPISSTANGSIVAAGRVLSSRRHNHEGPELYAIHPHRVFTRGRAVASGAAADALDLAIRTFNSTAVPGGFSYSNSGWSYAINAAALLGGALTNTAAQMLVERATTPPAQGYRFPAFAQHFQDFDPSADFFANHNRALQDMVLQSGEDDYARDTIVLLPSWPCAWDVNAKLWAARNTTVEIDWQGGTLKSLVVTPASRGAAIVWANCAGKET